MRLFVALNLSPSVIQLCATIQERITLLYANETMHTMRFIPPDRLHITLKPPMMVEQESFDELIDTLKHVSFVPFGLCTSKLSFFATTNILWLGIQESQELIHLVNNIQKATYTKDNPQERQRFIGHITLARSFKGSLAQDRVDTMNRQLPTQCFLINTFSLKETILNADGQVMGYSDRQLFDHC